MKKRINTIILLLGISISLLATSVSEVFVAMPDSVCPYFSSEQKLQLLDTNVSMAHNQLDGISSCDTISDTELVITIADNVKWQCNVETTTNGAIQYIITETVCAPICSSSSKRYDADWHLLSINISKWEDELGEEVYF